MKQVYRLPRGGLYLSNLKDSLKDLPITNAALPPLAIVSMVQQGSEEATCLVNIGDEVKEGMLIGKGKGKYGASVHSSIPGIVRQIYSIPLPGGSVSPAVCIELGGEFDRLGKKEIPAAWQALPYRDLQNLIAEKGVTDSSLRREGDLSHLIINGIESEPYLCSEYRLLIEKPAAIIEGIRILQKILAPKRTIVVLEEMDQQELSSKASPPSLHTLSEQEAIQIAYVEKKYPIGDAHQLKKIFKSEDSSNDILVISLTTVHAVYEAVVLRKPFVERTLTIGGQAIRKPGNLKVRIGTPIIDLVEECGGFRKPPMKVVCGGPFRGKGIYDLRTPVTKETSAVLFLTEEEIQQNRRTPCINCGRCIEVCPEGLNPSRLFKCIDRGLYKEALADSLMKCTECGCCAYICPARIPLVQGLQMGKYWGLKEINT
ncbi:MAG: RnfABCDGE type electron transport complex subunit C [Spirochaetales bacterium]